MVNKDLVINVSEELEMNRIQKSIAQISGSMIRLGIDSTVVELRIPKIDFDYLLRLIRDNPNWACSKYCKIENDGLVLVNNVKVKRGF